MPRTPGSRPHEPRPHRSRSFHQVRVSCVRFSPTGREWAAASPEGLLVYGLDEDLIFDPLDLDEAITPDAIRERIRWMIMAITAPGSTQIRPYGELCLVRYRIVHIGCWCTAWMRTSSSTPSTSTKPSRPTPSAKGSGA
jgi:hypothetical protein